MNKIYLGFFYFDVSIILFVSELQKNIFKFGSFLFFSADAGSDERFVRASRTRNRFEW